MEINHLRAMTAAQGAQAGATASDGANGVSQDLKPIMDGGLKVTVAERNVLDDIERMEGGEEPTRDDPIGTLVSDAFKGLEIPPKPDFV